MLIQLLLMLEISLHRQSTPSALLKKLVAHGEWESGKVVFVES